MFKGIGIDVFLMVLWMFWFYRDFNLIMSNQGTNWTMFWFITDIVMIIWQIYNINKYTNNK